MKSNSNRVTDIKISGRTFSTTFWTFTYQT